MTSNENHTLFSHNQVVPGSSPGGIIIKLLNMLIFNGLFLVGA